MSTKKRLLTVAEKHINRLRRNFEKKPSLLTGTLWKRAVDAFIPTPDGLVAYREQALDALRNARYYTPTAVYADGYFHAKALLTNAKLLEQLVDAKNGVALWKETREVSASLTHTSPEVLIALADDPTLVERVASNPSAPAELLERLSRDESDHIRVLIAANPSTPVDVVVRLMQDSNGAAAVAETARLHPAVKPEALAEYLIGRGVAEEDVTVLPYDILVRQVIAFS